jgi:hypothetical protein
MEETQTNKSQFPSAFSLFRPSLDAVMVNIWTFLGLLLIPMAGLMLMIPLAAMGGDQVFLNIFAVIVAIAAGVFFLFVAPALPFVQLQSVQGKQVSLGNALKVGRKFFWRFYGQSILVGLIIVGGLVLLIVPGIFMFKRYYLAPYYMYDQNLGILEAMRKSAADSKVFSGAIWGLLGVALLIQLPSVVPLFGLVSFVLAVMYYCAPAIRYFQIKAVAGKKAS